VFSMPSYATSSEDMFNDIVMILQVLNLSFCYWQ